MTGSRPARGPSAAVSLSPSQPRGGPRRRRLRQSLTAVVAMAGALALSPVPVTVHAAGIANVQNGSWVGPNYGGPPNNLTLTLASPSTFGTLLVAAIQGNDYPGCTSTTFTGPSGWVRASASFNSSMCIDTEVWYYASNPGGISSATFNSTVANTSSGSLSEWSGVRSSSPVDASTPVNSGGTNSLTSTVSATASQSGDLAITSFGSDRVTAGAVTYTPGSGWSNFGNDASVTGDSSHYTADYKLITGTGTVSETETTNVSSGWTDDLVLFLPAGQSSTTQAINASVGAGTLSVSLTGPINLGSLTPGTLAGPTSLGNLSFTDTLNNGGAWSVTLSATDLWSGSKAIPFTGFTVTVGSSITGSAGYVGTPTAGSSATLTGSDPTPGTSSSNALTLATGSAAVEGTFTQTGNQVAIAVPGTATAGTYNSTFTYTITG